MLCNVYFLAAVLGSKGVVQNDYAIEWPYNCILILLYMPVMRELADKTN